jgi:1-acyl-sn-glycerol-3-phosphate acyltransferase/nucleoside-diphosphate-sugar epimerase
MTSERIALVGYLGPLAHAVARALSDRGHEVELFLPPEIREGLSRGGPSRILCFPFAPSCDRRALSRKDTDLAGLADVLDHAARSGISRVVLRSHAIAYGVSMKNPGLLDEGRVSLLPKTSLDRRWLEAEQLLFSRHSSDRHSAFTAAAVRLVPILEPAEGDLIAAMLRRRITAPLAGYDPQLQLLSLSDAAECLICALLSDVPGIINGAPRGTVPVKAALRTAVPLRVPVNGVLQKPVRSLLWRAGVARQPGEAMDRIKYNWTVSGERAKNELGFNPSLTSTQALKQYLGAGGRGKVERIKEEYDEFGLDPEYLARRAWWFRFLTKVYWRAEVRGLENIPAEGAALMVANHRGFMPFDGVVHRASILEAKKRHIRFLVIPSLFKFPFLSDFLVKQGGVVASQANTQKLFARKELVGIFPEGINGAFRMYKGAYRLGDMSRNAFARMAIENGVPIIASATVGHVEIFPILAKVRSSLVTRLTGWPFLPITPTFPLLPVPLPTKWHIRYLEPISVTQYSRSDAADPKAVNELAATVCSVMQRNIDEMLGMRKHIFFGNIFGPRADAAPRSPAGATP